MNCGASIYAVLLIINWRFHIFQRGDVFMASFWLWLLWLFEPIVTKCSFYPGSDRSETYIFVDIPNIPIGNWTLRPSLWVTLIYFSCIYLIQARTKFCTPINTYLCVNLRNTYEKPFYKFNYLFNANRAT